MLTVRCPACGRLLKLPESVRGDPACCPLCRAAFPTTLPTPPTTLPPRPFVAPPRPRSDPHPPPRLPAEPRPDPTPFVFPEVAVEALPGDLRKALGSAVLCLKVYAGLGLLHLFTCSCLCQLGERASRFSLPLLVLGVLLRCVALVVVYHAAESMERGRKPALARAAGVLAVLGGAYLLLVSVGPRLIQAGTGRLVVPVAAWLALLLFTGVVAVLGIVGGARTLALLRKPEVERWFRR